MRNFFCLILLLLALTNNSSAQLCQGSLGDAVVNIDFGSGSNPGSPLAASTTSYTFFSNDCPNDGFYTVRNSTANCFDNSWHMLNQDHTGNGNGYFMLVNASFQPGDFYVTTVPGLCANTTYEFAAWIINVLKTDACAGAGIKPNLTFLIETTAGTLLQEYNTGDIAGNNTPAWQQYGFFFKTPVNTTDVVVRIRNNAPGGCGNDLALDDITFRPCGPEVTVKLNGIDSSNEINICTGDTGTYILQGEILNQEYTNPAYQWEISTDSSAWTNIAGANSATLSFTATTAGTYYYRMAVAEAENINSSSCRVVSNTIVFNINTQPVISLTSNSPTCTGKTLLINATGGSGYKWEGPNNYSSSDSIVNIPDVSIAAAGVYYVIVTSEKGCISFDSLIVDINPSPTAIATNDTAMCEGESVLLNAGGADIYTWQPPAGLSATNIPNPIATPTDSASYTVTVTNTYGCSDSATTVIDVYKKPVANAGPDKAILEGGEVVLEGNASGTLLNYSWVPVIFINGENTLQPVVNPPYDTTYTLRVESTVGCGIATDEVFVKVYKKVNVPNAFSPNNDGINDVWRIEELTAYPDADIIVFNRYGQAIFYEKGYSKPWDGTYNDKPLPFGTYYYVIDLKADVLPKLNGWVMILR